MRTLLTGTLTLLLCCSLSADDKKAEKIDPAKLVGKWRAKDKAKAPSVVVEFAKDGRGTVTGTADNGQETRDEFTYKVDGNKLAMTQKVAGTDRLETVTLTVSSLSEAELVLAHEKGQERTLVRIKDKDKK